MGSLAVEVSDHVQFDRNFCLTIPYWYCCMNAILRDESVPVAVAMTATESLNMHDGLCQTIEASGTLRILLRSLHVLLNLGKTIGALCNRRGLAQHFCHRHIIMSSRKVLPEVT